MPPRKRKFCDDDDDDDWTPPPSLKIESKNSGLLAARAKKSKGKGKKEMRCDECGKRLTDRVQLKNHRKMHGS